MKTIATALVAACLLAVPAGVSANQREAVSVRVSAQGVDFNNAASVDAFRARVAREIAAVCNPGDRVNADTMPDFKCRRELTASLAPKVNDLAMAAHQRAFASN